PHTPSFPTRRSSDLFGQKDPQQSIIIKQLVRDLAFDTEIVVLPIVREESGLAMSSRNAYLDDKQRPAANVLNRSLASAREAFEADRKSTRLNSSHVK